MSKLHRVSFASKPNTTFDVIFIHGLGGTLTLLFDCGFSDPEALSWLFTADETLPGTPVQALAERRRTEVNRRAQALAF